MRESAFIRLPPRQSDESFTVAYRYLAGTVHASIAIAFDGTR